MTALELYFLIGLFFSAFCCWAFYDETWDMRDNILAVIVIFLWPVLCLWALYEESNKQNQNRKKK